MMGTVWAGRLFGRRRPVVKVAAYGPREDTREWRLLDLLLKCANGSALVRPTAERGLRAELDAYPPSGWPSLDEQLRQWLEVPAEFWKELPVPADSAALPLFACDRSGFVRELAVQGLAGWRDGRELPALLLRANDWVPPVRARAADALMARLTPEYVGHWVRNLGLVAWLKRTGRGDHRTLVDGILALLGTREARPIVQEALHSLDRDARWLLANLLFAGVSPNDHAIVAAGLQSTDTLIRVAAAQAAEQLDDDSLQHILPLLRADRLPGVRAIGIRLAARCIGRGEAGRLRDALLDRSEAVRGEARRALEAVQPMDFAAFFRQRLHDGNPALVRAIDGLRETGGREDAALVRAFVDHPLPRVRIAALRALDRFAAEGVEDFLLLAIADPSRAVSTTAAKLLRPHVAKVAPGELGAIVSAELPSWARRNALSLIALRGKWIALPWLVRATTNADDTVAVHASVLLRRWRERFNRSFTQPTREQRAEALAALDRLQDRAPARLARWYREPAHDSMREWLRYILATGG